MRCALADGAKAEVARGVVANDDAQRPGEWTFTEQGRKDCLPGFGDLNLTKALPSLLSIPLDDENPGRLVCR